MSWLSRLFSARRMDREADAELRHHFDLLVAERMRCGLSEEEARRSARLEFGGHEQIKEDCRESRGTMLVESTIQDLRYAARQLRRNPGFATTAIVTLALGIGATTSIFSVFYATLLRPLPFTAPDRLVVLWSSIPQFGYSGPGALTDPDFAEVERQNRVFEEIAAFRQQTSNLTGAGVPERLLGASTTAGFFPLLGVHAELGRDFTAAEQSPGHENVVLISHRLWARRFASDPAIAGRSIRLDGKDFIVLGVMPAGFEFPNQPDIWLPLVLSGDRSNATDEVIARLRPGVTLTRAADDITLILRHANPAHPHDEIHLSFALLEEKMVAEIRPALVALLAAVSLVLLIACANVANLFLSRATARRNEILMRRTLGAGRLRIVRQLLTESAVIAGMGAVLGLAIALTSQRLIAGLLPQIAAQSGALHSAVSSDIDGWVLAFCLLSALATGILFGLAPALSLSKSGASSSGLSGRTYTSEISSLWIRKALIVAEFALTLVLLVGAGLLLKSFARLLEVKPGLDARNVVVANLDLPETKYKTGGEMTVFHDMLLDRLAALPGVRGAGTVGFGLPFGDGGIAGDFKIRGLAQPRADTASKLSISPGYFRVLGIPLIAGRDFDRNDTHNSQPAVIVSQSFARHFWPGRSAIGQQIDLGFKGMGWCTVVGVTGDVKQEGLAGETPLTIYLPYAQSPEFLMSFMTVAVRTEGPPLGMVNELRAAVQSVDPDIPIYDTASMQQLIAKSIAQPRLNSVLFAVFAALALVLASVGIYGTIAYSVEQRRHEIGVRMALGASRVAMARMVVGEGSKLTLAGIVFGLAAAFFLTRAIAAFLFGVTPTDPAIFAAVSVLLAAVALAACYIPARRASRVDPAVALRYE